MNDKNISAWERENISMFTHFKVSVVIEGFPVVKCRRGAAKKQSVLIFVCIDDQCYVVRWSHCEACLSAVFCSITSNNRVNRRLNLTGRFLFSYLRNILFDKIHISLPPTKILTVHVRERDQFSELFLEMRNFFTEFYFNLQIKILFKNCLSSCYCTCVGVVGG